MLPHSLELALMLIGLLIVMRAVSWFFGWLFYLISKRTTAFSSALANLLTWGLLIGLDIWTTHPGEQYDFQGYLVTGTILVAYFLMDLRWQPWKRRAVSVL